jgi:hypothetical protein
MKVMCLEELAHNWHTERDGTVCVPSLIYYPQGKEV